MRKFFLNSEAIFLSDSIYQTSYTNHFLRSLFLLTMLKTDLRKFLVLQILG